MARRVLLGKFGERGNGQKGGEWGAHSTRIAVIGEREKAGVKGEEAEEKRDARKGIRESGHDRLHGRTFLGTAMD